MALKFEYVPFERLTHACEKAKSSANLPLPRSTETEQFWDTLLQALAVWTVRSRSLSVSRRIGLGYPLRTRTKSRASPTLGLFRLFALLPALSKRLQIIKIGRVDFWSRCHPNGRQTNSKLKARGRCQESKRFHCDCLSGLEQSRYDQGFD